MATYRVLPGTIVVLPNRGGTITDTFTIDEDISIYVACHAQRKDGMGALGFWHVKFLIWENGTQIGEGKEQQVSNPVSEGGISDAPVAEDWITIPKGTLSAGTHALTCVVTAFG